jgi:DUF1680 family protein
MTYDNTEVITQQRVLPAGGVEPFKSDRRKGLLKHGPQILSCKDVKVAGGLWHDRIGVTRTVTAPFVIERCSGRRLDNFVNAAAGTKERFKGIFYNDSDVYKAIEGIAKSIDGHRNEKIELIVDDIVDKIAAAQWENGYLFTYYSLPERKPDKLWTDLEFKHELYCAGHLIEAALAYYEATGKDKLLGVAIRFADLICSMFGPGKRTCVPGHQEIEIALCKLYEHTGNVSYLGLADFFLSQRGNGDRMKLYGVYSQDHKPVVEQEKAVGHTVRAGYMYCAMADVMRLTGRKDYGVALDKIWENVVSCKMYLNGGVGAHRDFERYGEDYELPNDTAYCETCAAFSNIMWNSRMFSLKADSKYIDVLERILYNNLLAGVSLSGDGFFYANPLESDGKYNFNKTMATRKDWFNCSCCPTNLVRFIPTIGNYIYAQNDKNLFVNLFIPSRTSVEISDNKVDLEMKTDYPWNGKVRIEVNPEESSLFAVRLRIPGWSQGHPVPSDLYTYLNDHAENITICINGNEIECPVENGYAIIKRLWHHHDIIEMDIPMPVRSVVCHENVENNRGKVALERGPIVYCAEQIDNETSLDEIAFSDGSNLKVKHVKEHLGGVSIISGVVGRKKTNFTAIPYYSWSHRGEGVMKVWFNAE